MDMSSLIWVISYKKMCMMHPNIDNFIFSIFLVETHKSTNVVMVLKSSEIN